MRVSGVSVPRMALTLIQVGLLFSVMTFLIGEFVAPPAEQFAQQLRAKAITGVIAQEFRSGLWVKDERNFVNVTQVLPDTVLVGVQDLRVRPGTASAQDQPMPSAASTCKTTGGVCTTSCRLILTRTRCRSPTSRRPTGSP